MGGAESNISVGVRITSSRARDSDPCQAWAGRLQRSPWHRRHGPAHGAHGRWHQPNAHPASPRRSWRWNSGPSPQRPNPSNGAGSYRVTADALSKLATDNLSAKFCIAERSQWRPGGQASPRHGQGSASVASRRGQRWLNCAGSAPSLPHSWASRICGNRSTPLAAARQLVRGHRDRRGRAASVRAAALSAPHVTPTLSRGKAQPYASGS